MSNFKRPAHKNAAKPQHGYWLYGVHAASAALSNPSRKVLRIVVLRDGLPKIQAHVTPKHPLPEDVDPQQMANFVGKEAIHQGVAVQVANLEAVSLEEFLRSKPEKPLLLLDQVTDPHNVGAILRSAAAFDAAAVISPRDHAPEESAVLARSASGALEIVPFIKVTNLSQAMEEVKKAGYWCIGLDGEAKQTIPEAKLSKKSALILGAEGRGLRRLTAERCDMVVRLPISPKMESLNVSNAAAVALYELNREQKG